VADAAQLIRGGAAAVNAGDPPWYVARFNQKLGPFTWTQIEDLAKGGMLQLNDMLLQQGAHTWQEVSNFVEVEGKRPAASSRAGQSNTLLVRTPHLALGDYKQHLLATLRKLPASGFERLCQRLLVAAGFEQVEVTGRSGDGGIDGIGVLNLNAFVSHRVLFQCKRYIGTVGSPEVRNFRGAMQGRATRGVILTTGEFTKDATQEATRDGVPPIKLIDWEHLLRLFEKLKLGLTPRITFEIDRGFFREFQNLS
jgi:hypothetical protein